MTGAGSSEPHRGTKPRPDPVNRFIQSGLVLCIWFSALSRGAHDLWSMCVLCGIVTLLSVVFMLSLNRVPRPISVPLWRPLLALLAYLVITLPNSYNFSATRQEIWGILYSIIAFYLWINTVDSDEAKHRFFIRASWVLVSIALICLHEQWTGQPIEYRHFQFFSHSITYAQWEIHGTLVSSIILSGFTLTWVFYLWEAFRSSRWALVPAVAAVIVLGLSRSWWAVIAFSIGLAYYRYDRLAHAWRHQRRICAAFIGAGVLFIGLMGYIKFSQANTAPLTPEAGWNYSGSNRLAWWGSAIRIFRHHPWTGVGWSAFQTAHPHFRDPTVQKTLYAHSVILQLASELGLIGMMLMLWLVVVVSRASPSHDDTRTRATRATLLTLLAYASITISMEYLINKWGVIFLCGALLPLHTKPLVQLRRRIWLLPITALLIAAVPFWLAPFQASRLAVEAKWALAEGHPDRSLSLLEDAVALDPHNGDYFLELAGLYRAAYQRTRHPRAYGLWHAYLKNSARWKKDYHVLKELESWPAQMPQS